MTWSSPSGAVLRKKGLERVPETAPVRRTYPPMMRTLQCGWEGASRHTKGTGEGGSASPSSIRDHPLHSPSSPPPPDHGQRRRRAHPPAGTWPWKPPTLALPLPCGRANSPAETQTEREETSGIGTARLLLGESRESRKRRMALGCG